jgi:ketosteroid isomerase-like protein
VIDRSRRRSTALAAVVLCLGCAQAARVPTTAISPQAAVDELLASDRAYSAASARTTAVAGLSQMFDASVVMPVPGRGFAEGAPAVVAALRADTANAASRAEWAPIRGGISADGAHGFTFGFMTVHRADGARVPLKYLAYWVKRPGGWRVAAYRRLRRPAGDVSLAQMPPALPPRMVPPSDDRRALARLRDGLERAERAFSDRAQRIGLGPAFVEYGSADAVNMGGSTEAGFVVGSPAIGRLVGAGGPPTGSAVSWAPHRVLVASSGDLGITFGTIRPNAPDTTRAAAAGFPYFTIWRRASPRDPWRYVAE